MKTKLEDLTAAQFIDLACGDHSVIVGRHEIAGPDKVAIAVRNIIMEYRAIADPGGNAAYFRHVDAMVKARMSIAVYTMCKTLIAAGRLNDARAVLEEAGISTKRWDDSRIDSELHVRLQKSKRAFDEMAKEDDSEESEGEIRNGFNSLTASMMAHFKFQIDAATMKAPLFAHLVARYQADIKEMRKALARRK